MKYDAMLKKMTGGLEQRMKTQLKYEWQNKHPLVMEHICTVNTLTCQKQSCLRDTLVTIQRHMELTEERHRKREEHINDLELTQI